MLITRTPLRVSIGGGGTDLPSYYERFGGFVISAAIDRYIYVSLNRTFTDDYFLKYSALERTRECSEIQHPIIREALKLHGIGPGVEIVHLRRPVGKQDQYLTSNGLVYCFDFAANGSVTVAPRRIRAEALMDLE